MKNKMTIVAAMTMGFAMLGTTAASAVGGKCNGRIDAGCTDSGEYCTVYVQAARGCQIGIPTP